MKVPTPASHKQEQLLSDIILSSAPIKILFAGPILEM